MIITAPTKQQMIDDEALTGFKNIRMLRLSNIGPDITENTRSLKRYFAINCLVGQEVFITPALVFHDERTIIDLRKGSFIGADGKKYISLSMRSGPRWCEMKYKQCRCRFFSQIWRPMFFDCVERALEGLYPFDKMTSKTLEDEDEVRYTMEKIRAYYKGSVLTLEHLKRCARQRDLVLRKVDQSILEEGARCHVETEDGDSMQKIKNYINELRETLDDREALNKIRRLRIHGETPKTRYYCGDCSVSFVNLKYAGLQLQIDQIHKSKMDSFAKIKLQTKHTGVRSRQLTISLRGTDYRFDDILAEDGLDGLYYLMQQKF